MNQKEQLRRFDSAAALLPGDMRALAQSLPEEARATAEEFRLRVGRPLMVSAGGEEQPVAPSGRTLQVTAADIAMIMEFATRSSLHSAIESLKGGFLTVQDGHRIGICGTAVMKEQSVGMLRGISSLSVRIAREFRGIADEVVARLYQNGRFSSAIVVSPPGLGKTTLIRDIVRQVSDRGLRVGVADERSEIAALAQAMPRFDVGAHTDVLEGAPKAQGILMLLRTMSPALIAADEITAPEDVKAVEYAANCGTALLVSVHGADLQDVLRRPALAGLVSRGAFRAAVLIERSGTGRRYRVEALPEAV